MRGFVPQVIILSKRLHKVTEVFDELRTIWVPKTIVEKLWKHQKGLQLLTPPQDVSVSQLHNDGYSKDWLTDQEKVQPRVLESWQQLMDEETHALQRQRYHSTLNFWFNWYCS